MDYKVQIVSFIFSFIFGGFFYYTSLLNYKLIKHMTKFWKYFVSIIYIVDVTLLYVLIMFKINYGVIHVYFLLTLFLGFIIASFFNKKLGSHVKTFILERISKNLK